MYQYGYTGLTLEIVRIDSIGKVRVLAIGIRANIDEEHYLTKKSSKSLTINAHSYSERKRRPAA